jgi:hypothetical protein
MLIHAQRVACIASHVAREEDLFCGRVLLPSFRPGPAGKDGVVLYDAPESDSCEDAVFEANDLEKEKKRSV